MNSPLRFAFGSFSALMSASAREPVCTTALYVARTCGVSCSGIQVRAAMGSDWVYRNGVCRAVCLADNHCSAGESGSTSYSILKVSVDLLDGGRSMISALPRMASGLSRRNGRLTQVVSLLDVAPRTSVAFSLTPMIIRFLVSSTSRVARGSKRRMFKASTPSISRWSRSTFRSICKFVTRN